MIPKICTGAAVAAVVGLMLVAPERASAAPICFGTCGTLGADGDVTTPPSGGSYNYVSTFEAPSFSGLSLGFNETNGSQYTTDPFSANGTDQLQFYFNFVTSDGAGFPEYAYAQLVPEAGSSFLLFTARTCETTPCDTVPGLNMPPLGAGVVLVPSSTPVIANATTWSPLGDSSGDCFDVGCGNSGWIQMLYTPTAGNYTLQFGVVNVNDFSFDSGLAVAGALIGDVPIEPGTPTPIPEPATVLLLGTGLAVAARARRRSK